MHPQNRSGQSIPGAEAKSRTMSGDRSAAGRSGCRYCLRHDVYSEATPTGCRVGARDTAMGNGFGRFRANGTHRFWDATDRFCRHELVHACSQQATEGCYLEAVANGRENQKVDPAPISLSRPT